MSRQRQVWPPSVPTQSHSDSLWELVGLGAPEVTEWMRYGLCAQNDPEVFFPGRGTPNHEAKQVCAECPVRPECLNYALESHMDYGVWGGKSAKERFALRRHAPDADRRVA